MSMRKRLIDDVFGGCEDPLTRIVVQVGSATSPNGVKTQPKGTFYYIDYDGNASDGDVYINTDGATAWTQIRNPV